MVIQLKPLNDPEVLKLKTVTKMPWSHYTAGFVYEALNEPGLQHLAIGQRLNCARFACA